MFNRVVFFFKQKTAYEMRISDWSSDVCSSDLEIPRRSERLCSEHLELIVVEDEGEFQPQECGEQPEPYEQRNARAAPPHREMVADKLRAAGEVSGVTIGFTVARPGARMFRARVLIRHDEIGRGACRERGGQ